ncbi:MAG: NADH-quinone oxidoreductase subunit M [Verrucomicrobiia bacterium]
MYTDLTIYLTFAGAGLIMLLPREAKTAIRWTALLTGMAGLAVALWGYFTYNSLVHDIIRTRGTGLVDLADVPWIPALGIHYHLAVDGINFPLVVLNGFICVTGILFSWNIEERTKEFFAFFLTLIAGVYGVFMAMDLFLLLVFYELAIVPKYFLIAIWGSTRKEYGAMKLVLFSFVGSAVVFIAILVTYFASPARSFDLFALRSQPIAYNVQVWVFPLMFAGFAVLAGMWPFHTWAPTGHVAAPTAGSMLLAGVVMKLGAYGCLRTAMFLFPQGLEHWRWVIAWLAVVGIVYGAGVALVQKDFKFIIGYSSVSHMGFVLLGLATLNVIGMSGAVLQMFSHGIIASLLFAVVGRMVYDRTHTRQLDELGGLAKAIPFACVTFVIAGVASMGMPGFSGFVAEIQVLIGAFKMNPWLAVGAAVSIAITAAYILTTIHKVFFAEEEHVGRASNDHTHGHNSVAGESRWHLPPISLPEKIASVILLALLVIIGLYPSIMLDMIKANVELFPGITK